MIAYKKEAQKKHIGGKVISVVNLTPSFYEGQEGASKKAVEQQLYEVFCKYVKA